MARRMLKLGDRVTVFPVVHGSGDCALEVRRLMLSESFTCVATPLPPSFQHDVERAIRELPTPSIVLQRESPRRFDAGYASEEDDDGAASGEASYVPVDPCQPVIAALRVALEEHLERAFIDLETSPFEPHSQLLPDPYALKRVSLERFAAAVLPSIPRPPEGQPRDRVAHMAAELRRLERRHESVLFVCSVLDWPWIREAYTESFPDDASPDEVEATECYRVHPHTLLFLFGELPFITGLYERARARLEDDANLSIDGVKELLVAARTSYRRELRSRARRITPHTLSRMLQYIRNLSLVERRLTPDLYSIVVAAKQVAGDSYALHVAETARNYLVAREPELDPFQHVRDVADKLLAGTPDPKPLVMGIDRGRLPNDDILDLVSRLPGPPLVWRTCELRRRPERDESRSWQMRWNPYSQCSYPPEDERIENFRSHVFERALSVLGADLARTEKFTTSIKDGIDIRDTLRHWYEGEIYVKVLPPNRGALDCAVMLFDSPADPRDYPWRTTWYAEHDEESTLAFFGTDFRQEMIGPGIGLSTYGGAFFLFPPRPIPDIWTDERLDFAETLEERLLGAACLHSRCPHIALLSPLPPGAGWRRLASRFRRRWIHVPLSQFSEETVQQLRMMHVLNGREVRSYAADFIRRA